MIIPQDSPPLTPLSSNVMREWGGQCGVWERCGLGRFAKEREGLAFNSHGTTEACYVLLHTVASTEGRNNAFFPAPFL